ncbi:HD domain-containing protein [Chenggangzhangella methanolivorans]|uniref:HD domain-containing protein n=1 Tax=Chenggangzhangella methanolivorans TaxID=1437009 RepID=A0A9E6ULY7_9HYPH|nr:HD domain-containing protein [Chenggangzhangella methanolivorans]QZN99505.1 HD domain-containing protein [Chenggangzhangella methanolivorans]
MSAAAQLYEAGSRGPELFMPWADGGKWDLLAPDPATLRWRDLALRLARMPRFGGETDWSLAEHMMLAARLAPPEARGHALLHDAHEGILGDWVTPVKSALKRLGGPPVRVALGELERRSAAAVHAAAGLPFPPPDAVARAVDEADRRALSTERRDLFSPAYCAGWGENLPDPAPLRDGRLKPKRAPEAIAEAWLTALVIHAGLSPETAR